MNRNQMYHLLNDEYQMYPILRWADDRKSYHIEFTLNRNHNQKDCTILTDWGYIRHIHSIHLCTSEIVIESFLSDMKINIKYRSIEKFELKIEEE